MRLGFSAPLRVDPVDLDERPIRQVMARVTVDTDGPGFTPLTSPVDEWLRDIVAVDGLLTLFIRHTSASLTIQENADPTVQTDLLSALNHLAPRDRAYRHATEGPDDMPAHIRSMLTSTSLSVPVVGQRLDLGTWQDVYLIEHRDAPHRRHVTLHYLGS
ncbi:MAG: secondary thiamine-phosphate synthase enzyme YjbQ [Pseudomonadota bacterium]